MKKTILSFITFTLLATSIVAQETATLTPDRYNTIYEPGNLSNGAGDYFFAGNTSNGAASRRGLLHFDVSDIPVGSTITSVTLTLTQSRSALAADEDMDLHMLTGDWGQGTSDASGQEGQGTASTVNDANWACSFSDGAGGCTTSWTTPGGDINPTPVATTSVSNVLTTFQWTSVAMAANVQSWVNDPAVNFGWMLIGNEAVSATAKRFNATGADTPSLMITYTPAEVAAVNELSDNVVTLYPNPTSSNVTVELEKDFTNFTVAVKNAIGQTLSTTSYSSANQLSITLGDEEGVYFVEVSVPNEGRRTFKVVKE